MKSFVFFVVVLASFSVAYSKTYERCEFARRLSQLGFARNTLPDWVCLAEAESSLRSHVIGPVNSDGSYDYGIFQINSNYWCKANKGPNKGNGCNVNCDALLSDDIAAAAKCAQKVFASSKRGFKPWTGWQRKCSGKPLPDLSKCF